MAGDQAIRPVELPRDDEALLQVWREIGWLDDDDHAPHVTDFFRVGRTLVAEQAGRAEAFCHVTDGTMRLHRTDLRLAGVTAVGTSHVARRRGHARRLVAQSLATAAEAGAQVAGLGIFDQGFYDQLGFGTGPYEHKIRFDPATLEVPLPRREVVRITKDDWQEVHACLSRRRRGHGAVVLGDPLIIKTEFGWTEQPFGLGFRDESGELTDVLFGEARDEHGPYVINWFGYRDLPGLFDLLGAIRTLGDQAHEVQMVEPADVQMQDLLREPFRSIARKHGEGYHQAAAWWQIRVLDVPAAVAAVPVRGEDLRFVLHLHDPAADHLPDDHAWSGTTGSWVVTLGAESRAEPGETADLPVLTSGVGPFTRMLFGVRDASVLATTTDLRGPEGLLADLDAAIALPPPRIGWDY